MLPASRGKHGVTPARAAAKETTCVSVVEHLVQYPEGHRFDFRAACVTDFRHLSRLESSWDVVHCPCKCPLSFLTHLSTHLLTYIKLLLCFYYRFMLIFCVLDLPFYNIHQGQDRHLYHMYLWSYTQVNTGSFSKDTRELKQQRF